MSIIKGIGFIPFTPEEIKAFLWDEEESKKYDMEKEEGQTLEKFPLDVEVGYAAYKGKMLVSGRDFVYSLGVVKNDAGQVAIASTATEHDAMPPTKKKVRAHTTVSGWLLTPSEE